MAAPTPDQIADASIAAIKRPGLGSSESLSPSRRASGSVLLASGQTIAVYHRTNEEEVVLHATKKTMAEHLRTYEALFTLSAQRMRMIVHAFVETLELGLEKEHQTVVRLLYGIHGSPWS